METKDLKEMINEMPVETLRAAMSVEQFTNISRMAARSYADYMLDLYVKGLRAWEDELHNMMCELDDDTTVLGVPEEVVKSIHELGRDLLDMLDKEKLQELHDELLDAFHDFLENIYDVDDEEAE